mgnify:CR=1 FL=1
MKLHGIFLLFYTGLLCRLLIQITQAFFITATLIPSAQALLKMAMNGVVGQEAYDKIFKVLADKSFSSFVLTSKENAVVNIVKKETFEIPVENLLKATFNDEPSSVLKISFDTPAAFKSRNDYVIVPDLHLVFQSLMKKATAATSDDSFFDEETLDALVQNSKIISYNLRTVKFSLEGRRITGFTGYISIYIKGPSLLKNFAKTLFRFGEYLGVGIKASIGMGALSIKEDEK